MGHDPSRKIIALSYGSELAEELARQFRTVVESDRYRAAYPQFQIKRARRGEIITTRNGSRYACGLDGSTQRFLAAHAAVANTFTICRHLISAATHRQFRAEAFAAWHEAAALAA